MSNDLLLKLGDHVLLLNYYLLSTAALILELSSHQPELILCVHRAQLAVNPRGLASPTTEAKHARGGDLPHVFLVAHHHVDFEIMLVQAALQQSGPVIELFHLRQEEVLHHLHLVRGRGMLGSRGLEGLISTLLEAFDLPVEPGRHIFLNRNETPVCCRFEIHNLDLKLPNLCNKISWVQKQGSYLGVLELATLVWGWLERRIVYGPHVLVYLRAKLKLLHHLRIM
jgi:hypothetical protein